MQFQLQIPIHATLSFERPATFEKFPISKQKLI